MKTLVLFVTLAFVAVQLTCAVPTPESEKKETVVAALPSEIVDASSMATDEKSDVAVTEEATPWAPREVSKGPVVAAAKAQ